MALYYYRGCVPPFIQIVSTVKCHTLKELLTQGTDHFQQYIISKADQKPKLCQEGLHCTILGALALTSSLFLST